MGKTQNRILLAKCLSKSIRALLLLSIVFTLDSFPFQAQAAPVGPLIKHLSWLLKRTSRTSSSRTPQLDPNVLQFESGYLVETVVEGNEIGGVPYKIRVSSDGELYAVDEDNSNIMKITPPLSHYSRGRLVAGSFQGKTGHIDGKPSEARFNHPRGITMDDNGNVYIADTLNLAIRKIGDSGVTTIAGGKSNVVGYRDGPSEDAKFSNDFDVIYVRSTCSLLVIDRGNAALRQISLSQDDCDYQYSSVSPTDVVLVIGAIVIGYATCLLQQGYGLSLFSNSRSNSETELEEHPMGKEKLASVEETTKEELGWPSFGQLLIDLSKLGVEFITNSLLHLIPTSLRTTKKPGPNLIPLKDRLKMPEDEPQPPPVVQKQTISAPMSESRHAHLPKMSDSYLEPTPKASSKVKSKDPSMTTTKHRSSRRHGYAEFYTAGEIRQKSQKERTKHRHRDRTGERESKSAMMPKPVDFSNPSKFDHLDMRNKYEPEPSFRF